MGRKADKQTYLCNLLKLREEFKLTQKELGEILGVSERMICNYETGEITLPIDKAIFLCQQYNYTLDWIYCAPIDCKSAADNLDKVKEYPKFIVDIRDFLSYSNGAVFFSIPNYYWEYMQERNAIAASKSTDGDKRRQIAELNGAYKVKENEQRYWRFNISAENFLSYLRFDSKFIPFSDNGSSSSKEPSKEQIEEITVFIESLADVNNEL